MRVDLSDKPQITERSQHVICLAGHIDHGKSALVRALTGGTVDRLPEEKRRGITIELGFAHFEACGCRFVLIDVPGHERFIHTMVAGASGVDAALLVVAADDSVMPQTREHLALLELLGVSRGLVAIAKCDLVDEDHLGLVELELEELLAGTFLAGAPRLRVSAQVGTGVEALRAALIDAACSSPRRAKSDDRFRMPIDRAFSPAGQGAVVTGTVWRGAAKVGGALQLLPAGELVRIRRMQSQGREVDRVAAGERGAINLAGIKASAIRRGDELTTPNTIATGRRHLVQVRLLPDAERVLRHRQLVRLHLGANQVTAQVLMEQREVAAGNSAFAILRCAAPVVAEYGQPFVLRQLSPAATLGGGVFLATALRPSDRFKRCLAVAAGLSSKDPATRLAAYVDLQREAVFDANCESVTGLSPDECTAVLQRLAKDRRIHCIESVGTIYVSSSHFDRLKRILQRRCVQELERRRPASRVPLSVVLAGMSRHGAPMVIDAALNDLVAQGELVRRNDRLGLPSGAKLTQRQRQMLANLLTQFAKAGATPPTLKELSEEQKIPPKDLEQLVQVAVDDGDLVRLSPLMAMDRQAVETLRHGLANHFQGHPTAKVGELREQWGITRKHAVPIFEYFDDQQITVRSGDLRSPGPRLTAPIGEEYS